jgi:prepilin signal peptidase PulO-like enzyme (type II secretory pathway)
MMMYYVVVLFVLGLIFGSFNSVLISRISNFIESGKSDWSSLVAGRSMCPSCKKELSFASMVPVFSFLWQKGRCKNCEKKISVFYPLIEIITAFLFLTPLLIVDPLNGFLEVILLLIIVELGIVIAGIDIKTMRIPVFLSIGLVLMSVLYGCFFNGLNLTQMIVGGCVGYFFFGLQHIVSKGKWVGLGDADLGACIGFLFGPLVGIYTILQSYILGTIVLLPVLLLKKAGLNIKSEVPFGPFLILSLILSLVFGNMVVDWYLSNFIIL